jgi:phage shock protein PspC (stress-responsive transcriptional regulator)
MNPETPTTEAIDDLATSVDPRQRSLYRDSDDKMVAGVCSGLGHYFDIHTALVRVAFVVFTLLGGAGIFAYLILWFAIDQGPAPQTDLERSHQYEPNPETQQTKAA